MEWNGVNFLPHLFESIYIYQTESEYAINATRVVYESIMASDGSRSGIAQIFDNWLEDYENL